MSIEVKKSPTFYKSINTAFVNDKSLSLKAKGILVYLLSKPSGWHGHIYEITRNSKDGEARVKSGLKELVALGYAKLETKPKKEGKFQGKYYQVSDLKNFFSK